MADSAPATASEGTAASAVTYPIAAPPGIGDGSHVEIAPGHFWLRIPMPQPPHFTNVVAIAEADGWTLVDTGMRSAEAEAAWERIFAGLLAGRPVTRVIATHMHSDHLGMAGWILDRHPAVLWMSALEYMTGRVLEAASRHPAPAAADSFYRQAGWGEDVVQAYRDRFGFYGANLHPIPDRYRRVSDTETIVIAGNEWQVITGAGHSPDHVSLCCPPLGLYLAGDQLLPEISPNISLMIAEPWGDPLTEWLGALARIGRRVPAGMLAVPGHKTAFRGVHQRARELIDGHEAALDRLADRLAAGRWRCVDLFDVLFPKPVTAATRFLATGETFAHLRCLATRGRAAATADARGALWWSAA